MLPREGTCFQLPTTLLTPWFGIPLLQEKVNILWSFSNKHSASSVFEANEQWAVLLTAPGFVYCVSLQPLAA